MPTLDLLDDAAWQCCAWSAPSSSPEPGPDSTRTGAGSGTPARCPARLPARCERPASRIDGRDFDREQWWYRCEFDAPGGSYRLNFGRSGHPR